MPLCSKTNASLVRLKSISLSVLVLALVVSVTMFVLSHLGVIRLECSRHRGNSLSIAHEIHLYLGTGSLPLDLVVARL